MLDFGLRGTLMLDFGRRRDVIPVMPMDGITAEGGHARHRRRVMPSMDIKQVDVR